MFDISYEKVGNLIFRCANISCFQVVSESVFDVDFRVEIVPFLICNHNKSSQLKGTFTTARVGPRSREVAHDATFLVWI